MKSTATFKTTTFRPNHLSNTPNSEVYVSSVTSGTLKGKHYDRSRKSVNTNTNHDAIHLQLPHNSSSSSTASTEPLTPPTTPLQPQQHPQLHSHSAYRHLISQSSSMGGHIGSQYTVSSTSNIAPNQVSSSNSPSETSLLVQSNDETMRSSRLGHCQESHSIPDYYNCNTGAGNLSHSYWDGRTNSLSVIPALTSTSISETSKGFLHNLSSSNCENEIVQIGSPQCKGTPSPPHTSPITAVGQDNFTGKSVVEAATIHQHLVVEPNFDGLSSHHQDTYPSNYPSSHSQYNSPPYQPYFNSYYNQSNSHYSHPGYSQPNFYPLQHSPDHISPQLHYVHRKINSNSTSPGSSISTVPSISPSSTTVGSNGSRHKMSENVASSNSQSQAMIAASSAVISSPRLNATKAIDDSSWAI